MEIWVYITGYGELQLISRDRYFNEDWQYEGEDEYSGYTVVYSFDREEYACVNL